MDVIVILTVWFSNSLQQSSLVIHRSMPQNLINGWLIGWDNAITSTNVDPDLCRHMISLGPLENDESNIHMHVCLHFTSFIETETSQIIEIHFGRQKQSYRNARSCLRPWSPELGDIYASAADSADYTVRPNFVGSRWLRNCFEPNDVIQNGRRDLRKSRGTSGVNSSTTTLGPSVFAPSTQTKSHM